MYQIHQPYFLICESPLHVGVGSDPSDYIDNRIQREKHTEYPKIEGSAIKGSLRDFYERNYGRSSNNDDVKNFKAAFGSRPDDTDQQKGAINISELKILLFSVATPKGTFAWVTCPQALQTWALNWSNKNIKVEFEGLPDPSDKQVFIPNGDLNNKMVLPQQKVVLVNHNFTDVQKLDVKVSVNGSPAQDLTDWLGTNIFGEGDFRATQLQDKLVVLNDDVFKYLVKYQTDVVTGNRIDPNTGIVVDGALFTTEYLPDWTVMYGTINFADEFINKTTILATSVQQFFNAGLTKMQQVFQLGGKASTGKGLAKIMLFPLNPQTPKADEK